MKWFAKLLIALTVLVLLFGIGGAVYLVSARISSNEYAFQVDAVLQAAAMANKDTVYTEKDKAVIADYEGQRAVVIPENYDALSSYLRKDAMRPLWGRVNRETALHITVCDFAEIYIQPADTKGDRILIEMTAGERHFLMSARGGNLWTYLVSCCMTGTYRGENIILTE